MSKNLNLDPVLLNINSINSCFSEKNINLYGCYESQDSASYCCLKANVLEGFEMRRLSYICSKCLGIEGI
jgi:hypothetical protein